MVSSIDVKKQLRNLHCKNKREPVIPVKKIKLKRLAVLLDNCLKDVPRRDLHPDKDCKQNLPRTSREEQLLSESLQIATNVGEDPFINCHNESVFNLDKIECDNRDDYVSSSDTVDHEPQPFSLTESMLLQLPISNTFDQEQVTKSSMIEHDSVLGWEKLAEPIICDVKTPLTSGSSSLVDIDLTPPSSVASGSSSFEDRSIPLEDSFTLNFDRLPAVTKRVDGDKQILMDKNAHKELRVEINRFQPTLQQLQVLYRRNRSLGTATSNNFSHYREQCLRPRSSLKQFVPFTLQLVENQENDVKLTRKKRRCNQSTKVYHSTPELKDGYCTNKKVKERRKITNKKSARKQLEKQKKAFEKQQLKLILKQKKEALKYRNKFENALYSINRRLCNQNTFWRTLPTA